jgi:hypothetical protein
MVNQELKLSARHQSKLLMEPSYKYSGFISYRHSDRQSAIARALQRGLSRYAKPFWRIRAVRLFLDETNLSANPDLFGRIIEALDSSQNFLLMASPESASSRWVEKELAHWLARRQQKGLIIILTDGILSWDESVGHFNRSETTALPASLLEHFDTEPLYVDLRWAKAPASDLIADNPRFSDALATISAALRNVDKDDIAGEHLKSRRLFRSSVATIVTLLIGLSIGLAYAMFQAKKETEFARVQEKRAEDATTQAIAERNQADEERNRAKAELARAQRNESITLADQSLRETATGNSIRGIQLALSALPADRSSPDRPFVPRAEFALAKAVSANRLEYAVTPSADWVNQASFSPDGTEIALATRDGFLKVLDSATGQEIRSSMERRQAVLNLAYSPDGKYLATAHQDPPSVQVRNAATGKIVWSSRVKVRPQILLFTPDSSRLITAATTNDVRPHVWEVATGAQASILDAVARGVNSVSVSPDGRLLAFVTYWNDGLFIWDIETSELLASFGAAATSPTQERVAIDFSAFEEQEQIRAAQFARKTGELVLVGKRTIMW